MRRISTGDARERFAEIVSEAAFADKRTLITRHGKEVAAVVPIADLDSKLHPRALPPGTMLVHQSAEILTVSVPCNLSPFLSLNNGGGS